MANENKKEALELEKESVKTLEEKISKLEKLEEQYSRINNIQGTFEQSATKEKEALEAKLNLLRIEKEIKDALLKTIDQTGKTQAEIAAELEKQFKSIDEQNLSYAKGLGLSEEMVQNLKKAREESEKLTKESKEYEKSLSGARNMASELGKASVFFSTNIVGMAKKMQSQLKAGDQATRARIDAMKDQFLSFSNFLASTSLVIIETTKKLVMAADAATTTLAAATGMGRQLNDVLVSAQRSGNLFALTMEESGKAITALVGGTTNFVNVSKASQAAIATNVGLLSKLGVSAETSAEMIQNLNLNLGMTLEQASETAVSLAMMGTELGISASQITKDFNQSLGTLAVYGPRATTVFKNLAASAKSAGVETSKLLGIAKKFDTFGEAANTVGRLNALLGTQLSTTEMLMKTEDERIETLIESVQAQGVAFKDLDRFQQKAIAAAAGIDDLAEAQRIFGMDIGMYREYQKEMEENEAAQAKFQEALSAAIPLATQLMAIFNEFGTMVMPILDSLQKGLTSIRITLNEMSPATKELVKGAILLGGAFATVATFAVPLLSTLASITTIIGGVGAAGGLAAGVGGLGAVFAGLGTTLLPVLGIIGAVGGGLYLLNKAVSSSPSSVRASGRLENSTVASTGRATRAMASNAVQPQIMRSGGSQQVNVQMPDKVVLKVGEKEFEGYFMDLSRTASLGR